MLSKIKYKSVFIKPLFFIFLICTTIVGCKKKEKKEYSNFSTEILPENIEMGNAQIIISKLQASTLPLKNKDSINQFYENRDFAPVWSTSDLRDSFIHQLIHAKEEGLEPQDYHLEILEPKLTGIQTLNEDDLSELDILLTDAYFEYGNHLLNGKINPEEVHEIWDVPKNKIAIDSLLNIAIDAEDIEVALNELRPKHAAYKELMLALKEYESLKTQHQSFTNIELGDMIKHDEEDSRIIIIQERLKSFGYLNTVDTTLTKNTIVVQEAIKRFQEEHGLLVDGVIGNGTIALLNKGYDTRYKNILVNLERWRWFPRNFGEHYFLINIANYELIVVKDNDTVRAHKTMVGTGARKTPLFSDSIKHIVYNPSWYIPPTIQNKDVIPGMRRDPEYLSKKNINVYSRTGEQLDPGSIDWSKNEVKSYQYKQNPGSTNPLGVVKIMYPNKHMIYLHDTPSKTLFERNSRAQSSGCVRVQDAIELSKYLLSDQKRYSSEKIDEIIATGKTYQINLSAPVNIHHLYWTVWQEDGKTRFTEDIYNYDDTTYALLYKNLN